MLTFRESNKSFKLDGDLLKMMTNYKLNVGPFNPQDGKILFGFRNEMKFDIEQVGRPSTRDESIMKLVD